MPALTQTTGTTNNQEKIENLIAYLLSKGQANQPATKRALERAALPDFQRELARSQESQFVDQREQIRPLEVKKAGIGNLISKLGIAGEQAGISGMFAQNRADLNKQKLEQALAGLKSTANAFFPSPSLRPEFAPVYNAFGIQGGPAHFRLTNDPGLANANFRQEDVTAIQNRAALGEQATRYGSRLENALGSVQSAQIAQALNKIAAMRQQARAQSIESVISAIQNRYLLPDDIAKIRSKVGV